MESSGASFLILYNSRRQFKFKRALKYSTFNEKAFSTRGINDRQEKAQLKNWANNNKTTTKQLQNNYKLYGQLKTQSYYLKVVSENEPESLFRTSIMLEY